MFLRASLRGGRRRSSSGSSSVSSQGGRMRLVATTGLLAVLIYLDGEDCLIGSSTIDCHPSGTYKHWYIATAPRLHLSP